jgi:nucleoside-diphosphate-sugar epimerase
VRVFVTGATGFIGSAIVRQLIDNGHQVVGLARSEASATALTAAGATPHRGSLEDLDSLRRGAASADGAIHTAFFHEFGHASVGARLRVMFGGSPRAIVSRFLAKTINTDRQAFETLGSALTGPDRPLVAAFGTMGLTAGRLATENQPADLHSVGGGRSASEAAVFALADRGVRASVVRLPPVVHGPGDRGGFIPRMVAVARKNRASLYVGDGLNRWGAVHQLDAARLFVLALEKGDAGGIYHAVAEEGLPVIDVATAIGRGLDVPVKPVEAAEAARQFSWIAPFLSIDNPTSSTLTRNRLGWEPTRPGLLDDLTTGSYFAG